MKRMTGKKCQEGEPDAAERRPRSGFPIVRGDRRRPSCGASRPIGKTIETHLMFDCDFALAIWRWIASVLGYDFLSNSVVKIR
ncbi:hypothetical protein MKW98_029586 [Papaver atlanticum]|uniref:Uncharacterized protein n=1 Tax=Papaver atlanticum TaxID=357466 RepID=A0AAD4S339_9MAGN|nr:hypothetical protein MKW98_029586 [Papaver atlanticum]